MATAEVQPGSSGGGRQPASWPASATSRSSTARWEASPSFAAGFSYISILTGVTALFGFGYLNAGPGVWWTWPVVVFGQILVALCFMEMAGQYPIAGSVYQWSKQIAGRLHVVDDRLDLHRRRDRDDRRRGGRLAGRAAADHDRASSSSAPPPTPALTQHQGRRPERAAARRDPGRHHHDHQHARRQADVADQQHRRDVPS